MQIDKETYNDLNIFTTETDGASLFTQLNYTTTNGGKDCLAQLLHNPLSSLTQIQAQQALLQHIQLHLAKWPCNITNGTILMLQTFYSSTIDAIPANASSIAAAQYVAINNTSYALVRYSITHFEQFYKGLNELYNMLITAAPPTLVSALQPIVQALQQQVTLQQLVNNTSKLSPKQVLQYANYFKNKGKQLTLQLIAQYHLLDAWYALAKATETYKLSYPTFSNSTQPQLQTKQLYHLLLSKPVAYDIALHQNQNFLFLTGANMAGKSTFIKAVGIAIYMAHLGMAVPAASMQLCMFDGLLSNIQMNDNITKGESYFYNEVQRIKTTVQKINNGQNWFVLIDELFKGTNVQDAMKCSLAVIQGLLKIKQSLFILSTHLYEIGTEINQYPNILCKYFETQVVNHKLQFSYQLLDGISNDRIGYIILQREGVVDMLEAL